MRYLFIFIFLLISIKCDSATFSGAILNGVVVSEGSITYLLNENSVALLNENSVKLQQEN